MMLINANALAIPLPDKSVHMVVTSPPYWGLRDYGIGGQFGLERTPEEYVANMVAVFREVWRVLRDDATCWLNLGDSYNAPSSGSNQASNLQGKNTKPLYDGGGYCIAKLLKPKDLVGIPWRVAFALQANGWYLRSDIIWSKPNPMPESVTDRPTKAHEYLFLLSKSQRYFYDADAVREEPQRNAKVNWKDTDIRKYGDKSDARHENQGTYKDWNKYKVTSFVASRNRRTVWTIATQPYKGAHFATFPEKLVEPCILAGTSERGCCPKCGKQWVRVVEKEFTATSAGRKNITGQEFYEGWEGIPRGSNQVNTLGFRPSCTCDAGEPIPSTVLDPFAGSGTVGVVCQRHGRKFIGLDLSMPYLHQAQERIAKANGYHVGRLI